MHAIHPMNRRPRWPTAMVALGLACAGPMTAVAADVPPAHQLSFSASASLEVTRDVLTVSLQAVRDGTDAAVVQSALKQVLDTALNEARKAAEPGALAVRTEGFNLALRYGREGKPSGWTGTAGLVLEGRDIARVAATAGKLTGLTIVGAGYSLSRELRERHEAELTAQAIQKFRSRADEMARQFGYSGYQLREVNVQASDADGGGRPPLVMMRASAAQADAAPMPTEAGKGLLSATVQGTVTLTR
ncbi:SIMPL domain-containing protein [Sphaerotilus sp.]|uniref:SIMPL domain-containing protein n=1 Tax=Sphaerotilus sp. TaxID=2093942 RepID=UPI0025F5FDEC|nr:SIMPL domain-containing protein [Sphaerotilus sp.]